MAVVTYKCPNCDGGLIFDAESQKFHCEYCLSYFTEEELVKAGQAKTEEKIEESAESAKGTDSTECAQEPESEAQNDSDDFQGYVYTCPSCGAEVVVSSTTAASHCCFCHNPVLISGRLEGNFKPDCIIPFAIDQDEAVERFFQWFKKKWFVPKNFFSKKQISKISGVYFPYWVANCDAQAQINASATKVRSWRSGNMRYTETSTYSVVRAGDIKFRDISKNALSKANKVLAENVQPFDYSDVKDFNMAYLSGFEAEKRDIESAEIEGQVRDDVVDYSAQLLRDTISGYDTVSLTGKEANMNINWRYALVPVWLMTFKSGGKDYFYAMNGQNGTTCGKLPLSRSRLAILFASVFVSVALIILNFGGAV